MDEESSHRYQSVSRGVFTETMSNWKSEIAAQMPGFDLGLCHWLRRLDAWDDDHGRCLRFVLDYAGQCDVAFVAKGVNKMPLIRPAATPGVLPYAPFDLGELLITEHNGHVVLFDELKGWKIVAESLSFEIIGRACDESF